MGKFNSKLSKKEVEKYFYQLCVAISETKNAKEVAELLRDLLSYQEAEMIAKRLKIAELLLDEFTYDEIQAELKVSAATIARVQEWIRIAGEGYQKAARRIKGKSIKEDEIVYNYDSWGKMKKRFPAYYWPELLLETIIREANERQRKKINSVISEMEKTKEKSEVFYKIRKIMVRTK